jgi:zinc transport system ATP-binding protein
MATLLEIEDLCLGFDGKAILGIAKLAVEAGDFACIVGANGAGKSTLVKAILGLIKPMAGTIRYLNGLARTQIGYLPQETRPDGNFPATVEEIVLSGCLGHMGWRPFYCHKEKQHVCRSLKTLGINDLAKKSFVDLSGGQKQKVLLARSLSATTKMLILDEPSNNLDHKSRKDFYKTLKTLNRERGLTILMITHDLDANDLIGNKIISIKDGEAALFTTKEYLEGLKK